MGLQSATLNEAVLRSCSLQLAVLVAVVGGCARWQKPHRGCKWQLGVINTPLVVSCSFRLTLGTACIQTLQRLWGGLLQPGGRTSCKWQFATASGHAQLQVATRCCRPQLHPLLKTTRARQPLAGQLRGYLERCKSWLLEKLTRTFGKRWPSVSCRASQTLLTARQLVHADCCLRLEVPTSSSHA